MPMDVVALPIAVTASVAAAAALSASLSAAATAAAVGVVLAAVNATPPAPTPPSQPPAAATATPNAEPPSLPPPPIIRSSHGSPAPVDASGGSDRPVVPPPPAPPTELTINATTWDARTDVPSKAAYTLGTLASAVVQRVSDALRRDQTRSAYRRVSSVAGVLLAAAPLLVRLWYAAAAIGAAPAGGPLHLPAGGDHSATVMGGLGMTAADAAGGRLSVAAHGLLALFAATGGARGWLTAACSGTATAVVGGAFFRCYAHAEEAYTARLLSAKYFAALTSLSRARKHHLPHFRLHKIPNLRMWLSLRSLLRRRGSRRAVDVAVAACFALSLLLVVALVWLQGQRNAAAAVVGSTDAPPAAAAPSPPAGTPRSPGEDAAPTPGEVSFAALSWLVLVFASLSVYYLLRFLTLTSDVSQKHRDSSQQLLLTEQINLSLRMLRKPSHQRELSGTLGVLKLATKLLKE